MINQGFSNEQTRMFEWGDSGMNANLITIMEGYNDPRLPLYVTKNQADVVCEDGSTIASGTKYLGIRGGCNLPVKPNQWGNFSKIVCSYTTAFPIMKAAEGYFLRAEGILRGWNMGGGTAQQWYEDGIRTPSKMRLLIKALKFLPELLPFQMLKLMHTLMEQLYKKISLIPSTVKIVLKLKMMFVLNGMKELLMNKNYNVSLFRSGLPTSLSHAKAGLNIAVQVIQNSSLIVLI